MKRKISTLFSKRTGGGRDLGQCVAAAVIALTLMVTGAAGYAAAAFEPQVLLVEPGAVYDEEAEFAGTQTVEAAPVEAEPEAAEPEAPALRSAPVPAAEAAEPAAEASLRQPPRQRKQQKPRPPRRRPRRHRLPPSSPPRNRRQSLPGRLP